MKTSFQKALPQMGVHMVWKILNGQTMQKLVRVVGVSPVTISLKKKAMWDREGFSKAGNHLKKTKTLFCDNELKNKYATTGRQDNPLGVVHGVTLNYSRVKRIPLY